MKMTRPPAEVPPSYAPERPLRDKVGLVLLGIALGGLALLVKQWWLVPWLQRLAAAPRAVGPLGLPVGTWLAYGLFVGLPLLACLPTLLLCWRGARILRSGRVPPPGERVYRRTRIRSGRIATVAGWLHFVPTAGLLVLAAWGATQAGPLARLLGVAP